MKVLTAIRVKLITCGFLKRVGLSQLGSNISDLDIWMTLTLKVDYFSL